MLKSGNTNFYDVLFSNNKLINSRNDIEKNISEELLTIRTLVLISPPVKEMEEYVQLEKMLGACKLQREDYKVEQVIQDWIVYRNLENIKEILLFGITEKDLNITLQFNDNQINRFDNRIWIKSAPISDMIDNQTIKNNLWQNALKPYFIG